MVREQRTQRRKPKRIIRAGLLPKGLVEILEKGQNEGIRWRKDGWGFTIHDYDKFYKETLKKYFPNWTKIQFLQHLGNYFFIYRRDELPYFSYYNDRFHKFRHSKFLQSKKQHQAKLKNDLLKQRKGKERKQKKIKKQNPISQAQQNPRKAPLREDNSATKKLYSNPQLSRSPVEQKSMQSLQQNVFKYFTLFKKECDSKKGDYIFDFMDIQTSIGDIKSSKDLNHINAKAKQVQMKIQKCCQTYRNIFKGIQNLQTQLVKLFENKPNVNANGSNSQRKDVIYDKKEEILPKTFTKDNEKFDTQKTQAALSKQEIKIPSKPAIDLSPGKGSVSRFDSPLKNNKLINEYFGSNSKIISNQKESEKVISLQPPLEYLHKYFTSKEVTDRLNEIVPNNNQNQSVSTTTFKLDLKNHIDFEVRQFIQYDWSSLEHLSLLNCYMITEDWIILSRYAPNFKKLKVLSLANNKIDEIRKVELQSFPKLRFLILGALNQLTQSSKNQLLKMQNESKKIQISM